jgi:hypothetical protein
VPGLRASSLIALAALLVAACGGGADDAVPASAPEPPPPATGANAITVSPFDEPTSTDAEAEAGDAEFPAEDPAGVLALAERHPDGEIVYQAALDGRPAVLAVVRSGQRGAIELTRDDRVVRVGVDLADATIRWTCVAEGGGEPSCADGDIGDAGSNALATAALLIGADRIRQIVTRIAAADDAYLEVEARAGGVDASCLTGSSEDGAEMRICVSPSGFVTDATDGALRATGVEVATDVDAAALERPASAGVPEVEPD